jgi:hydrogenase expression/formation protein HypC
MCLAVPGKVISIDRQMQPVMGLVSFGGVKKNVCLEWLPEANVGDYVIVHVGFALSRVDEQEALETIRMLNEMGEALDDLDAASPNASSG